MRTIDLISLIGNTNLGTQSALAKTMRVVCKENAPVTIDGAGDDQVVMLPLETFNKLCDGVDTLQSSGKVE